MTPQPIPHPRAGSRRARWAAALAGATLLALLPGGPAAASTTQTGPSGPTGSTRAGAAVECLDERLRPVETCPAVDVEVHVELDGDDLVVAVANAGDETWKGGPIAVELPVPTADVEEPEGRADPTGRPGTAEWTTRVGTVVSRCVFEPVTQLRSGADLTCRLHRLGLPDGEHVVWITGFVGGLPLVGASLGDAAPAPGVVAAAATRSVRVRFDGDRATVVDAEPGAEASGPEPAAAATDEPSPRTARLPFVLGATAIIGVATGLVLRRRRTH